MKNYILLFSLFCLPFQLKSQTCNPVIFPKLDNGGNGGKICLEGSPNNASPNHDICFRNTVGYLAVDLNKEPNAEFYFDTKQFKIGNSANSSQFDLMILGPNMPNNSNSKRDITFQFKDAGSSKIRSFRSNSWDTYLQFMTTPNDNQNQNNPIARMQINPNGKVLIGDIPNINTPGEYNLYVTGGVLSEKFKAAIRTSSQWSDHVFYDDYELKPLKEVEQFIQKNKHLPGIPSADELVKDGIDLVDMQAKQMEKIEELTLYLIEMKKEIKDLKDENKILKSKIESLEK